MLKILALASLLILSTPVRGQSVAWQPWSPGSFAEAKSDKKLVLVDAEATWCHWCHVMEEKTYGDPRIQKLLRERFAAIKADIDVHPDAHALFEDIGWPGTAIYAPDGRVLWRHRGFIPPEEFEAVLAGFIRDQGAGTLKAWDDAETAPAEP
ncbi:MAG: DUF255 domain-containing protein, partial [Acidobacteriota bacterium]|nr:DUF255 domain-containing protein [Acidobacteriota bacterium]